MIFPAEGQGVILSEAKDLGDGKLRPPRFFAALRMTNTSSCKENEKGQV